MSAPAAASAATASAAASSDAAVPLDAGAVRAILFDVDGTLYRQGPVRRRMLARLALAHAVRPLAGWRTMRALGAYRRAQEAMRHAGTHDDLAAAQLRAACAGAGLAHEHVAPLVARWMEESPLDLLAPAVRPGLRDFLDRAAARGLALAVVSDYPAAAKLAALGVADRLACVVCAQDAGVGAFKPDPRGIVRALERLGVAPAAALYVGDRPEVDAVAAARAGVPAVIVGQRDGVTPAGWVGVSGYPALGRLLGFTPPPASTA